MPPEARQKLKDKLQAIDDAVTRQELSKAIEAMLVFEKNLGKRTEAELTAIKKSVDTAIERIQTTAENESESSKQEIMDSCDQMMNEMRLTHEAMMAECDQKMSEMKDGMDGMDADEEVIVSKVLAQIPPPETVEEETPESVRNMLETLKGDDRLDKSAIKGIEILEQEFSVIKSMPRGGGATRGFLLRVNGTKQGMLNELNIVGSGVSITKVNGLPTITITGGSGATAVETPTGTVDGTNLAFTVTQIPLYLVSDGVSKFETIHYTRSGFNITFIDGNQPRDAALGGYIRSVYSA